MTDSDFKPINIFFHMDQICVRGTSVATYDYMKYNVEILRNQSFLILPESAKQRNDPLGVVRFESKFGKSFYYKDLQKLDDILEKENCSILYCIKYGKNDGVVSKKKKTVVHCVFDMSEPHGNVYAGVSKAVMDKYGRDKFVPHMIALQPDTKGGNWRREKNIPPTAIVFGRYGGDDTFNIQFCWEAIWEVIQSRKDIYFLFINTPELIKNHPQVIYLPKITTEEEKNKFISTCDAHLECGTLGHSFGCAIGEFSVCNKPIIAFQSSHLWNRAHIDILGDKALYFHDKKEFQTILTDFENICVKKYGENWRETADLNCYKDYSPEKVMKIFKEVFIDEK